MRPDSSRVSKRSEAGLREMVTTYDPAHPLYRDEADVRLELARVHDVCSGCRRCVDLCGAFPALFELVDRFDDRDAGRLTPAEQDEVGDHCFQCKMCAVGCPFAPGVDAAAVDVPRLMLRWTAMRSSAGLVSFRRRVTDRLLARTGVVSAFGGLAGPVVNRVLGAPPGSVRRTATAAVTGLSAVRLLPPYARQRFSTWFRRRPAPVAGRWRGAVTVFPSCLVEYHEPGVGRDLVRVLERNAVRCELSDAACCGAPWLQTGDVDRFAAIAERNVRTLAGEVRRTGGVVVPEPTCSYVLRNDYRDHVPGADAELLAANTYDAAEYLMRLHDGDPDAFDTDFRGGVPAHVTYHVACHRRAQPGAHAGRDLIALTGSAVTAVEHCAGIDGSWGLRREHDQESLEIGRRLADRIESVGRDAVAGDCSLANLAITEQTGVRPAHPVSMVARAYGIEAV
jgi:Fe-S oxidoreductase